MNVDRLAREVAKFVEASAALAMQGPIPSEPLGNEYRVESHPPASDSYIEFAEANIIPAGYIDWRVAALRRSGNAYGGVRFAYILGMLSEDPGCVSRWENQGTKSDRANHAAWTKMCRLVADSIRAEHPDIYLRVMIHPKAAPLVKRDAKHVDRRWRAEDAKRLRYERLQAIEQRESCARTLAVEKLAKEMGCGKSTIWESVQFCEEVNAS